LPGGCIAGVIINRTQEGSLWVGCLFNV